MRKFPKDIPNKEGFRFKAYLRDGTSRECRVAVRLNGTYYVRGAAFRKVIGWEPMG